MSRYAPISEADRWFEGENKQLQFVVYQDDNPLSPEQDITTWNKFIWTFERYEGGPQILRFTEDGGKITKETNLTAPGYDSIVQINIDNSDTAGRGRVDGYHHLWRMDPGQEQLLAEGPAILREA